MIIALKNIKISKNYFQKLICSITVDPLGLCKETVFRMIIITFPWVLLRLLFAFFGNSYHRNLFFRKTENAAGCFTCRSVCRIPFLRATKGRTVKLSKDYENYLPRFLFHKRWHDFFRQSGRLQAVFPQLEWWPCDSSLFYCGQGTSSWWGELDRSLTTFDNRQPLQSENLQNSIVRKVEVSKVALPWQPCKLHLLIKVRSYDWKCTKALVDREKWFHGSKVL